MLANELGFDAAYLDRIPFLKAPGVRFADQAKFHPLKFLTALAGGSHGRDSPIFEKSAVTKFDAKKKRARANGYWINYDRVVFATNNPLLGESSLCRRGITCVRTKIILIIYYRVDCARRKEHQFAPFKRGKGKIVRLGRKKLAV